MDSVEVNTALHYVVVLHKCMARAFSIQGVALCTHLANLNAGIQVNFIQERGTKPHFSHMFVFSSAHSCCVRDSFQALKRVRRFGSPELCYCLDTLSSPKERRLLCTTLEAAGRHVKRMAWLQEHYCGEQVFRTEEDIHYTAASACV